MHSSLQPLLSVTKGRKTMGIFQKKVLITGGSRGIGKECVKKFSQNGYKVFFTYLRSSEEAERLSRETGAIAIKCDVSKAEDVENLANEISKHSCSIDCIVNNAGIAQQKLFTDISEDEWDNMFNVNMKSMFLVTRKFVKGMINNHSGSIVNISSIWGLSGGSCEVHYSASKAAVIGFTHALSDELGPSGIRVNCVAPGVIDTDMNSHLEKEDFEVLSEDTPLHRIGSPEEVADAVYYLSDSGSFITGEIIKVSGGF